MVNFKPKMSDCSSRFRIFNLSNIGNVMFRYFMLDTGASSLTIVPQKVVVFLTTEF